MPRNGRTASGFYPVVRWLLKAQVAVGFILVVTVLLVWGESEAKSAGLGVLAGLVPNWCFARRFGVRVPSRNARQVVRSFYVGEAIKLLMTAGLFAVTLQVPGVSFSFMFSGFVLVISVSWFALLVRGIQ